MAASQSLPDLVAAAQFKVKTSEDRIVDILKALDGQQGASSQLKDLRKATVEIELEAVNIFSLFETLMQHHFRRGPFSRKLKTLLLEAGQTDLAERVYQHYLAINVLKHGKGASYRELLDTPDCLFVVKSSETSAALVDVGVPGFFDGLVATILEAYQFLESR